jgi:hypothetical protein
MNKQHTPPQQQQHYKSIVVHVSSNTLKAPLVYSLDSGELGYRAGERGEKATRVYSPFSSKETRERVITSRQKNSTPTVKKRSNFPWPEKRKRVRKTKEEVKKKMVENQNKNIKAI